MPRTTRNHVHRRSSNAATIAKRSTTWDRRTWRAQICATAFALFAQGNLVAQEFPNNLNLLSVWGSSSTDVWAAGVTRKDDQTVGLYHFDGESWTQGAISDALRNQLFPNTPSDILEFQTISGNASNNIYAVATRSDLDAKFVVRFDGTQWDVHGFVTSDKYFSSYVAPDTGDVYIGGRALAGGGSIIRKASGGAGPHDPAGAAFALVVSSSAHGFGVTSIAGIPGDPQMAQPGEVFFATTNGLFQFGGSTMGINRVLIDGWGTYQLPAVHALPFENMGGETDVLVANAGGVAAFTWNGTTLTANGDTGSAPPFLLGAAGSSIRVAAYHSTLGG